MKSKNVKLDDDDLKSILDNPRSGPKNHFISDCPMCGKSRHFYINRDSQLWDCKKCGEQGNIILLLSHLGKLFLLGEYKSIERGRISLLSESEDEEMITTSRENYVKINPFEACSVGYAQKDKELMKLAKKEMLDRDPLQTYNFSFTISDRRLMKKALNMLIANAEGESNG